MMYNLLESERQFVVDVLLDCYNRAEWDGDFMLFHQAQDDDILQALAIMGEEIE